MCYRLRHCLIAVAFLACLACLPAAWAQDEPDESFDIVATEESPAPARNASTDADNATDYMVGVYYAHSARNTENRLAGSGLAKTEIDSAVDAVAQEYAACIVTSLQKTDNQESAVVIEMLADGWDLDDVGTYMYSLGHAEGADPLAVFDTETSACRDSVDAGYGLNEPPYLHHYDHC